MLGMSLSNGCKSLTSPNSGNRIANSKGVYREVESEGSRMLLRKSTVGKVLSRRTETLYKAGLEWISLHNKIKSNATRTLYSK